MTTTNKTQKSREEKDFFGESIVAEDLARDIQDQRKRLEKAIEKSYLSKAIDKAVSEEREKVFDYLLDHYWDTLDEDIVKLHLKATKKQLTKP